MPKKIQVTFSDAQALLLDELKGILGDSDAEVVRAIVMNWLLDKGMVGKTVDEKSSMEKRPNKVSK